MHRSFKFVVLSFEKIVAPRLQAPGERNASAPPDDLLAPTRSGSTGTTRFPAAFMRHDAAELARFPQQGALWLEVELIRKLSPEAHAVMEFKSAIDLGITRKMLVHPALGQHRNDSWNLVLHRELHMTGDSRLFKDQATPSRIPVVEGKMIHQFESAVQKPRSWIEEAEGRKALLGRTSDLGQDLPYAHYRLAYRSVASSTNERSMIAAILPPGCFSVHSLNVAFQPVDESVQLLLLTFLNSFCFDYFLRQQVSANLTQFFIYQSPVPRLQPTDPAAKPLVDRAARLTCVNPRFTALAKQIGLEGQIPKSVDEPDRARLRAEIDGLVAHLYGLTEDEFAHILASFPLVADPVKVAARNAYRDVAKGLLH